MARVHCYIPDHLKERAAAELPAEETISGILVAGLRRRLDELAAKPAQRRAS